MNSSELRNEPAEHPAAQTHGLYRPAFEHDACGIGALAHLKGKRSHQMIDDALSVLVNLEHRGGVGLEKNTGDGAGILFQVPHRFFRKEAQKCGIRVLVFTSAGFRVYTGNGDMTDNCHVDTADGVID